MPRKNPPALALKPSAARKANPVWKHNSFFGYARMMEEQAKAILKADTTTIATKELAVQIIHTAQALSRTLKERVK